MQLFLCRFRYDPALYRLLTKISFYTCCGDWQRGQPGSENPQDVVRELYAGVDLAKLVQRMLVVMHEVNRCSCTRTWQIEGVCKNGVV